MRSMEIQQKVWYWCKSKFKIADWLTRGKKPSEISLNSDWKEGPLFLKQPEGEWSISRNYSEERIPKTIMEVVNTVNVSVKDDLASRIKIERLSDYNRLLRVTARILKLYHREPKAILKKAAKEITSKDVETAEVFWVKEAQQNMKHDIKHGTIRGRFRITKLLKMMQSVRLSCVTCKKLDKKQDK